MQQPLLPVGRDDGDLAGEEEFPRWFHRVYAAMVRTRWIVIVFWMACLVWGLLTGESYVTEAEDAPHAPPGSRAAKDFELFNQRFPRQSTQETVIVVASCRSDAPKGCTVVCPKAECTAKGVNCRGEHASLNKAFSHLSALTLAHTDLVASQISYYNFSHTALDPVKCELASEDGKLTFVNFFMTPDSTTYPRRKLIDKIIDNYIPEINPDPATYEFSVTGFEALSKDGSEQAIAQILKVDMLALPLAYGLLGYMVRSWRLLLLALVNVGVSVLTSFAFLALVAQVSGKKALSTTSSLVEVLGLAMSIDYSLFLLRRFRDELKNGRSVDNATQLMLLHAGHVVILSSGTFALVFVGLMFLDSEDLTSLGSACTVTILITLVGCMSNTVALLTAFPEFFSRGIAANVKEASPGMLVTDALTLGTPPSHGVSPSRRTVTGRLRHHRGAKYEGLYFEFLKRVTRWPMNLILVLIVYGLAVPLAIQVGRLKHNQDVVENIPRGASSARTFKQLLGAFPGGTLSPFYIIVAGPADKVDVTSRSDGPVFYSILDAVTNKVAEESGYSVEFFSSPAMLQGNKIPFKQAQALLNPDSVLCKLESSACKLYQYMFDQSTSQHLDAAMITIVIPDNPYGSYGHKIIDATERVMNELDLPEGYSLHLTGTEVLFYSDMRNAFGSLPLLFVFTLLIIFSLIGLGFRSALVPIRLGMTLVMPLVAVFGFAVLVYQDGVLDWMGVSALNSEYSKDGFFWYIPVFTLLQCIGLCLDYDVFLSARILEHRVDGYEIQAAIIKSVWEVNSQIVAAGVIMAVVFAGLLTGDSLSVNQFGFLLCSSVLVDTFIVQTLLVPAIFSFGDGFLWWPRKLVNEGLITLDDAEFSNQME